GDVGVALGAHAVGVFVDEFAVVGNAFGEELVGAVRLGVGWADAVGAGVHRVLRLLVGNDVRAQVGGGGVLAHADGHGVDQVAVLEDLHVRGVAVGLGHPGVVHLQIEVAVGLAVDVAAEVDAVDGGVHLDRRAGLPVDLRAVVHLALGDPVPAADLLGGAG